MNHRIFNIALVSLLLCAATPALSQDGGTNPLSTVQEEQDYSFALGLYRDSLFQMASEQFRDFVEKYPNSVRSPEAAFLSVECAFATGQYASALDGYTEFLHRFPRSRFNADARFRKGQALLQLKRPAEAVKEFRSVLEKDNDRDIAGEAAYWIGESYFKDDDSENAIKYYLLAAEGYPNSPVRDYALYSIGWTYQRKNDLAKAAAAYTRMANEYPKSPLASEALVRTGECYYRLKEYDKAQSQLKAARPSLKTLDHLARCDYVLADAWYQRGQFPEAEQALSRFVADYPSLPLVRDGQYALGWTLLKLKQPLRAVDVFGKLSGGTDPLAHAALFRRGVAFGLAGLKDSAQACFDESVRRFPAGEFADNALYEIAAILFDRQRWKECRTAIDRLVDGYPESEVRADAIRLAGECLLAEGNFAGARERFSEAESLPTASPEVRALSLYQAGWSAFKQQKHAEAAALFNAFITQFPSHANVHLARFWKGEAEYAAGRFADARASYLASAADKTGEKREEALYGAGWSALKLARYDDAIENFERVLADYPKGSRTFDARVRLGDCYFYRKDYAKAAASYQMVIRMFAAHEGIDEVYYQLGQSQQKHGDNSGAYKTFQALVALMPRSPFADDAQFALGWINFQRKEYGDAIKEFQAVVRNYPEGDAAPRALYSMGDAYYNQQQYVPAEKTYRELLKRYPAHPLAADATTGIQYCLVALGREQEAIAVIDDFVRENPASPVAADLVLKKADLLFGRKEYAAAAAEYRSFTSRFPKSRNYSVALYRLAESYRLQGSLTEAAETYEKAAMAPGASAAASGRALLEAARIYIEQKATSRALAALENAARRKETPAVVAEARLLKGVLYERAGNSAEAAATYKALVGEFPAFDASDQARMRLARMHLSSGQPADARPYAERVATARKDALGAEAQCLVADSYAAQRDWQNALKAYLRMKYVFGSQPAWVEKANLGAGVAYERLGDPVKAADQYRQVAKSSNDPGIAKEAQDRLKSLEKR